MRREGFMIKKFISPGDKLELKSTVSVVLPDGTEGVKTYRTFVHNVLNDGRLEIVMPMEQTKLILLPIGGEYDVCFFSNGGMYRANIRIVDRQKRDGIYIVVAEMVSGLYKYQRREYYRFNCVVDMRVRRITAQEAEAYRRGQTVLMPNQALYKGIIVDISGGGARFVSRQKFHEGNFILMDFSLSILGQERSFLLLAEVIYSGKIVNRTLEYENRVKFVAIDSAVREEIIKYIFGEERRIRKKGKI